MTGCSKEFRRHKTVLRRKKKPQIIKRKSNISNKMAPMAQNGKNNQDDFSVQGSL